MPDVLSDYHPGVAFDEMVDASGSVRPSYARRPRDAAAVDAGGAEGHRRGAGQQLHAGRRDLRRRRRRAAVPAGPRPARHRGGRVGHHRDRRRAAGAGDGGLPRRRLLRRQGDQRRRGPEPADHDLGALPPGRLGPPPAQRRPHPRGGGRPHPDARGRRPGARGQLPGAERRLVRHDEPDRDDHRAARRLRQPAHPLGRRLPGPAAAGAAQGVAGDRRPEHRRAHPGGLQLRLLRAHAARPHDGRRARRGPRPGVPPRQGLHAHDRRACAASTSSTAASTTTSSTRSSSAATRCWACPAWSTPSARAGSRWPTPSATASPTTS